MAKDLYHNEVKAALQKEGWIVTDDPYILDLKAHSIFTSNLEIDLGAEKILGAEKGSQKIAIEIKTLSSASLIYSLHNLVGQYVNYRIGLKLIEPERLLYVAIPEDAYLNLVGQPFFQMILSENQMNLIVYEPISQSIIKWI